MAVQAASIETVDSEVLALTRGDIVWHEVRDFFPDDPEGPAAGVNLVELLADDQAALGDTAGPATVAGLRIAKEHGFDPDAPSEPSEPSGPPSTTGGAQ